MLKDILLLLKCLEFTEIKLFEFFPDGMIQFFQAEEGKVSEGGEDPAFGDEDGGFHFGFIFGFTAAMAVTKPLLQESRENTECMILRLSMDMVLSCAKLYCCADER